MAPLVSRQRAHVFHLVALEVKAVWVSVPHQWRLVNVVKCTVLQVYQ